MMNGAEQEAETVPNDLANMLKPALGKGDIKVVASTAGTNTESILRKILR